MFDVLKTIPRSTDWATTNHSLNLTVEELKSAFPHKFLQPHELKKRNFYHEPTTAVPLNSFVIPAPARTK